MKLIYKGKFDGDPESLPHGAHRENAVPFREIGDPKQLARVINLAAALLTAVLFAGLLLRYGFFALLLDPLSTAALFLTVLTMFPHELLHALCFRRDVYLYTNWKQGMLFVTGPEDMSRGRFVFMSLLPNLLFGAAPYLAGMLFPALAPAGLFGALCFGMGAGDYLNVWHALTQMPRGARTYLYGFRSFWYLPQAEQPCVHR